MSKLIKQINTYKGIQYSKFSLEMFENYFKEAFYGKNKKEPEVTYYSGVDPVDDIRDSDSMTTTWKVPTQIGVVSYPENTSVIDKIREQQIAYNIATMKVEKLLMKEINNNEKEAFEDLVLYGKSKTHISTDIVYSPFGDLTKDFFHVDEESFFNFLKDIGAYDCLLFGTGFTYRVDNKTIGYAEPGGYYYIKPLEDEIL